MKNVEPFLLRFKKESISLSRVGTNEADDYDSSLDMMMTFENGKRIPVIDSTKGQRRTKKMDMEKGEDQKDTLMWR